MARGAAKRGKRVAFGDGHKIIWDVNSELVFRNNPNIAHPGSEHGPSIEWVPFYRGHRIYNKQGPGKWIWNYEFRATPGEIFFSRDEKKYAEKAGKGFVVIEPNVPAFKSVAPNKQWPTERFDQVALNLRIAGYEVVQLVYGPGHRIAAAKQITTPTFRYGVAMLAQAALYIGPEGGLHHGSAAVGIPGVVLFGGFVPPAVTGYDTHTNLTGGAEACGSLALCQHCKKAMAAITVEEVTAAAMQHLNKAAA
jgi:ADP-heptose:LPS heptosyltransferase